MSENENDSLIVLSFFEKTLLVCLMDPILTWDNKERLQELYEALLAGGKGTDQHIDQSEDKRQMKQTLEKLRTRFGF